MGFEVKVGNKIVLNESDEFYFDKADSGDVFVIKSINHKTGENEYYIEIVNEKDTSLSYFIDDIMLEKCFKPFIKTDENKTLNKVITVNSDFFIDVLNGAFIIDVLNGARVKVFNVFNKCTIVAIRLVNGFVIVESSNCFNPDCFDILNDVGVEICLEKIVNRIIEHEAYTQYEFAGETIGFKNAFISGNDGAELHCFVDEDNMINFEFDIKNIMR